MILDLGNGREMRLPDDMDEEVARQLGKLILGNEQRAQDAEDRVRSLEAQFAQLKNEVRTAPAPQDLAPMIEAIQQGNARLEKMMVQMINAQMADRVMITDDVGRPRSKVVPN